ncbi:MAG: ribokinase [Sphaerochaetaceae bacterium]|jgi:ribokinase
MSTYCVIGSLYYSLSTQCERFPNPGEHIEVTSLAPSYGGPGGNIAATLASFGAKVSFIGKVGSDSFGKTYIASLQKLGVLTSDIKAEPKFATGMMLRTADAAGEQTELIYPGANAKLDDSYLSIHSDTLKQCDYLLLQGDIPSSTAILAKELARKAGKTIFMAPGITATYPAVIYDMLDYITPSREETKSLTGIDVVDGASAKRASSWFFKRGARNVLITCGAEGVFFFDRNGGHHFGAYRDIRIVDETDAGDVFNAAFAFAIGRGDTMQDAIYFAQAAAAVSIQKPGGAQASIPSLMEIEMLCNSQLLDTYTI